MTDRHLGRLCSVHDEAHSKPQKPIFGTIMRLPNRSRTGQFSTYLKPILILIFGVLLVMVVNSLLNFQTGLSQQEASVEFQSSGLDDFERLSTCLSVNKTSSQSSYLLNKTTISHFEREYPYREPDCAENFAQGYEATITQQFMQGISPEKTVDQLDIVLVIDDSGSMCGSKLQEAQNAAKSFIDTTDSGTRIGVVSFSNGGSLDHDLSENEASLDSAIDSMSACGGTNIAAGINAGRGASWREDAVKGMIVMTDGNGNVGSAPDDARSEDIVLHGVMFGGGASTSAMQQVAGGDNCQKNDAENTDNDRCWWAASGDDLEAVYQGFSDTISSDSVQVGGDTTCSLPPTTEYNGTVDLAFLADTSASYDTEWDVICDSVTDTIDEMEARGLDANVSIYGLAPDADELGDGNFSGNDQGTPMEMQGSAGSGEFDYTPDSRNVPACIESNDNVAVESMYGKGIAWWNGTGLGSYDASRDHGLEAWGVGAKWVLENHDWRSGTDRRMMFLFGDTYPTGAGGNPSHFREESEFNTPNTIDSDPELITNITNLSNEADVDLFTFVGDSWEGNSNQREDFGDPSIGDAEELMQIAADETGGEFMQYNDAQNLPDRIKEQFKTVQSSGNSTCDPLSYSFGQQSNTEGVGVAQQSTLRFPVTIQHSSEVRTPGTLELTRRAGEMERLAGLLRQIYEQGQASDESVSQTARVVNNNRLEGVDGYTFDKNATTTYHLTNADTSDDVVEINDELIVGVDGYEQFRITDAGGDVDLGQSQYQFESYRGRTLQVIAVNQDEDTGMDLDSLGLTCASGCSETQSLGGDIHLTEGDSEYQEKGGIGVFYHNFTEIQVGDTTSVTDSAVCIEEDNCITLGMDIEPFTLDPGSHIISVEYNATADEVVLNQ